MQFTGEKMLNNQNNFASNIDPKNFMNTGKIPNPEEFILFKKKIAPLINLDLTNYKNTQMERRITSLMNRNGIENLNDYFDLLKSTPNKLEEFVNMLTINVSEFFRNPEKFVEFETKYLPELVQKNPRLKIWSAGCSIGAEIYSIAMILDKHNLLDKCDLIASDFDKTILKKAQTGIYTKSEVGTVPPDYTKYFKAFDNTREKFQIEPKIVSKVKFESMDLLNSKYSTGFDLILCRNVVIYFTEEAKDRLYENFYNSLKPGGILFIGSTERINNHKNIGYTVRTPFFYQK